MTGVLSQDRTEDLLVDIWSDVLGLDAGRIDRDANFFALGGSSLSLVEVVERVNEVVVAEGGEEVPLTAFFTHTTVSSLARHIARLRDAPAGEPETKPVAHSAAVAIVGMAGRFPGAADVATFWDNLRQGVESYRPLEGIDLFDAGFFGVTPREASLMSPEQRLLLECVHEALESAGYGAPDPDAVTGVFVSAGQSDYAVSAACPDAETFEAHGGFAAIVANTSPATRIAYLLDLKGPSFSVDTACSSSLVAVHLACRALRDGECDMALAGGISSTLLGREHFALQVPSMKSRSGHCRPFDDRADGAVFMPGMGIVVLKRLEDARRDRDRIVAIVRGSAINNDGREKVGYTAPGVKGQARVIRDAFAAAKVDPDSVRYIETHGTGTRLGDSIEIAALNMAFGSRLQRRGWCTLGALKANVGHLEVAAGIAGLIKAALVVQHGELPPARYLQEPNREIGLDATPYRINTALERWPDDGLPRRAGVSSFGIGGTNAHVVIEQPPPVAASRTSRTAHLVPVSAGSPQALESLCRRLAAHLERARDALADVAFTLQVGRAPLRFRRCLIARDLAEARQALLQSVAGSDRRFSPSDRSPAIALVFSDHWPGALHVARDLYRTEQGFRAAFDEIARSAASCDWPAARDVAGLCADADARWTPEDEPGRAAALLVTQYAVARLLMSWGIQPTVIAGQGVGLYAAACASGELPIEEAMARLAQGTALPSRPEAWAGVASLAAGALVIEIGSGAGIVCAREATPSRDIRGLAINEDDAPRRLQEALGLAWEAGVDVDWRAFNAGEQLGRVPLPTYPFERRRYWQEPARCAPTTSAAPSLAAPEADVRQWLYVPTWVRSARPGSAGVPMPPVDEGCCLVFEDDSGLGLALAAALKERHGRVIRVTRGAAAQSPPETEDRLCIDPDAPAEYRRVLRKLKPHRIREIVYVGSEPLPEAEGQLAARRVLYLCQALHNELRPGIPSLLFVTNSAYEVVGGESVQPVNAIYAAMAGVIAKELPATRCRTLDVQMGVESASELARKVVQASRDLRAEEIVAIRASSCWRRVLQPARDVAPLSNEASLLREGGVYLVTGGTGGVGLALAEGLAARWRASIVLVSRSAPRCDDTASLPKDSPDQQDLAAALERMRSHGAQVATFPADVSDGDQVDAVLQFVVERFGRLDGVIHAAGVLNDGVLPLKTPDAVTRVFAPKVRATCVLWDAVKPLQPDFFLCCASISSIVAPAGQLDYAAANAFQDAFAWKHDASARTRFISVDWDGWRNLGMAAALAKRRPKQVSDYGVTREEGQALLERILGNPQPQWVVSLRAPGELAQAPTAHPTQAALSAPSAKAAASSPTPATSGSRLTKSEEAIARLWHELLGRDDIGAHDNFMALGGDSLLVVQMASQIESKLGRSIPVRDLMRNPTVAGIAGLLSS